MLFALRTHAARRSIDGMQIGHSETGNLAEVSTELLRCRCQLDDLSPTLVKSISVIAYHDGSFDVYLVSERLGRLEASTRRNRAMCDKYIKSLGDTISPASVIARPIYLQS